MSARWRCRRLGVALAIIAATPLLEVSTQALTAVPAGAVSTAEARRAGSFVLIGVAGLAWTGVSETGTPRLAALPAPPAGPRKPTAGPAAALGSMSVRSAQTPTCPVDGWLTLAAGTRAVGPARTAGRCPALPALQVGTGTAGSPDGAGPWPRQVVVAGWAALSMRNAGNAYHAAIGTLGATLAGGCVTAVGRGAALATADRAGVVARWAPLSALDAGLLGSCRVTVIDAGSGSRAAEVAWRTVTAEARAGTTVLITSIADGPVGAVPGPQLGAVALETVGGAGVAAAGTGGLLTSTSTRWPGVVALTDLTPTVLAAAGVTAPAAAGLPGALITRTGGARPTLASLQNSAVRARVAGSQVQNWFTIAGLASLALLAGLGVLRRRGRAPRRSRLLQVAALAVFCLPVCTRLASIVPWWRASGHGLRGPAAALWGVQLAWMLALAAAAITGAGALDRIRIGRAARRGAAAAPTRDPTRQPARAPTGAQTGVQTGRICWPPPATMAAAVLAAFSVAVTVLDVVAGSPLSRLAVLGLAPVDGSRFHGLGNEIVAATETALLLGASIAAGPLLRRGRRIGAGLLVAGLGLAFTVVDGAPTLGDDFGGVPAAVVGTGITALLVSGVRLGARRVAAVLAVAATATVGLALADAARGPGRRTHVGDFVVSLAAGRGGPVIARKAGSVVGPFLGQTGTLAAIAVWVGLVAVLALAGVVLRPRSRVLSDLADRWPAWRAGVAGTAGAAAVGAALNDSGVVVLLVATGATVAALTAVVAAPAASPAPSVR